MFGSAHTPPDLDVLVLRLFTAVLTDCAAAGHSAGTDPTADTIALWLGLHGLAHQRTAPWSTDLVPHVVTSLARTTPLARRSPP
jgi:hypothetical protein